LELDQEELQSQLSQAAAEKMALVTYERLKRIAEQQTAIVPAQQMDEARMAWRRLRQAVAFTRLVSRKPSSAPRSVARWGFVVFRSAITSSQGKTW